MCVVSESEQLASRRSGKWLNVNTVSIDKRISRHTMTNDRVV